MGDLRNKYAKIERAAREKAAGDAWLRSRGVDPNPPPSPSRHLITFVCRGCLRNHLEIEVYFYQRDRWAAAEYWCLDCMPADIRAEAGL